MVPNMSEEFGPDFITVTDEDGNEFELEHLDTLEYNGQTYMAFFPAVEGKEDGSVEDVDLDEEYGLVILKVIEADGEEQLSEELSEESETEPQEETVGLTVEIPLDKVAVGNLTKLLDAKGSLIKKALGVSKLPIEIQEDRVAFPWFPELPDADAVKAYTHFISALCEMSKNAKRVTVTEKAVDNEKYAFRCFLLRLGFIGNEYKVERKILLKNLTGSSAFKNGGADHAVSE